MKKQFIILRTLFVLAFVFTLHNLGFSQPPPPPSSNHGSAGNAPPGGGGGAPIGDGLVFLVGMAGIYGARKVYLVKKNSKLQEIQ